MRRIDEKLPVDASVLDDTIESGLCRGDIIQVIVAIPSSNGMDTNPL